MKTRQVIILVGLSLLSFSSESFAQSGSCAGMDTGPGADLNGFIPFPADSLEYGHLFNAGRSKLG